ncbi:MAG: glycogen debranching enzyme N-terminal domain-containing protein, partial [Lentisphaeria bacterium]|nr:glycogen debranching enzyme N-terminal domain-containing protein [Lentisphaeria bacterium]
MKIKQIPETGKHLVRYTGDTIEFRVQLTGRIVPGKAFLCTNLGNAALRRNEIIQEVEERITAGGADWSDLPMEKINDYTFSIRLALTEPGHFECKCSFIPDDGSETVWAEGHNVHVNVEPAAYCCSNSVYCAFVRQFGENKNKPVSTLAEGITQDELLKFDDHGYALIPGSGTFRDLIRELDHIVNYLKCRIVHLLPVNPTPTVYGRMGRFGSPYASLDFTAIDPALAEFDRKATPLDQFIELADEIHKRDAKLFIDIAINHTGWAAKLHETNPDWLVREADGTIHSPGAWGVVWGDLTELDHTKLELWKYLADMFLVWCSRGVDGFRCDAGYMIPASAWEYITARVRQEFPETVFLLEGLGGDPAVTRKLLDQSNLNWAYSELFQNYSRSQIEGYLRYAWGESSAHGTMIHYAETHDNNRLAAISTGYASMRTALAALSSVSGAFGFANGVEWFATQKIDVHEASALNWGAEENQNPLIKRLNLILALHPAFRNGAMMEFVDCRTDDAVLFTRTDGNGNDLLAAVNLNCEKTATLTWDSSYTPELADCTATDLISGKNITVTRGPEGRFRLVVPAAKFVCLSCGRVWLDKIGAAEQDHDLVIDTLTVQEAKTVALQMNVWRRRSAVLESDFDSETAAARLLRSPETFMKELAGEPGGVPFIHWNYPEDLRRDVMLPPNFALFATAPHRFRCRILDEQGKILARAIAMKDESGRYFVLIPPLPEPVTQRKVIFQIRAYSESHTEYGRSYLVLLPADQTDAAVTFSRNAIYGHHRAFMQANGCGALIHQRLELEQLQSRYDAILLANLSADYPEDRHIMWRRIRVWVLWHARRQEVKHEHLHSFHVSADGGGVWEYHVPVGTGLFLELCIKMEIVSGKNAVIVTVFRRGCNAPKRLPDHIPVQVIVRPDIEDRNFHYNTKAAQGPEHYWKDQIIENAHGFEFAPASDRILSMICSEGTFKRKDEWLYMNWMENEASRGLDPNSDLFSPGTFRFTLLGNDTVYIAGEVLRSREQKKVLPEQRNYDPYRRIDSRIENIALRSLGEFVVKRDDLKTVIAGYPWFLDWGRDTLIAARGLIAADVYREDVKKILTQFARFEENGTIPNMIAGNNAANRDTSDAPLWLFVAAADLCRAEKSYEFLDTVVRNDQTFRQVLESLAEGLIRGTENGIQVDPESFLVFSPPHFTWMDTNYPAGTPREGYPVEIQALWFAALDFLAAVTELDVWHKRAEQVRSSILKFYMLPGKKYLSDCLHCSRGVPAAQAVAD